MLKTLLSPNCTWLHNVDPLWKFPLTKLSQSWCRHRSLEAVSGGKYGTGRAAQSVEDCFLRHIGQLIESLKTFDMTLTWSADISLVIIPASHWSDATTTGLWLATIEDERAREVVGCVRWRLYSFIMMVTTVRQWEHWKIYFSDIKVKCRVI